MFRSNSSKNQKENIENYSPFDELPNELMAHTLSFLDKRQLARSGEINKRFYLFSRDPIIQKHSLLHKIDYTKLLTDKISPWKYYGECIADMPHTVIYRCFDPKVLKVVPRIYKDYVSYIHNFFSSINKYISPDTKLGVTDCLFVSNSSENQVFLYELKQQNNSRNCDSLVLHELKGHVEPVSCVLFMENNIFITGSRDRTLRVWDTNGKCLRVLQGHYYTIRDIVSLGDNKIVSCDYSTMRVWDYSTGKCLKIIENKDAYRMVAIDNNTIVNGTLKQTLQIWNIKMGVCKEIALNHSIHNVYLSEDGNLLIEEEGINARNSKIHTLTFAPLVDKKEEKSYCRIC